MAKAIARISGTALKPGVSKNGRLYTAEAIGKAVARAKERLSVGTVPLNMMTHHKADDDSTRIVGMLTKVWQESDGRARYNGVLFDTTHGHNIANLADTTDGQPAGLRTVSIRGFWAGTPRTENHQGQRVETADDIELDGLDFTKKPGVDGADVDDFAWTAAGPATESSGGRYPIYESAPEVELTLIAEEAEDVTVEAATTETNGAVEEKGAAALKSGKPAAPQTAAKKYADPGYQDDKAKRYALDTKAQAKAAWSYINQAKNAKLYTPNQLKRVKQRILAALKTFGIEVDTKEHWVIDSGEVTESEVTEYYGDMGSSGSFRIELNNGPVCVTVSSYCIDPADLDVIGRAAMGAACDSLKSLDPDMDGDIDVDGAPSEDTDNSMETAPETPAAVEAATETAPAPVADTTTETEALVADETTTTAVAASADTTKTDALPGTVTLSADQFAALLAAVKPAAPEPVLAGVAAETVPAVAAATTETAPAAQAVTETQDQMVARLVEEGIKAALPTAIQEHVEQNGVQRKGLVAKAGVVTENAGEAAVEYPEGWPRHAATGQPKLPHEMSNDEFGATAGPLMLAYVDSQRRH